MSEKPDMQVEEGRAAYTTALPEQKAFFSGRNCNIIHVDRTELCEIMRTRQ